MAANLHQTKQVRYMIMEESITLTFKDIDQDEANHRLNAINYIITIENIKDWLRAKWRYPDDQMFDIDKLYDEFFEIINSNDIKLN